MTTFSATRVSWCLALLGVVFLSMAADASAQVVRARQLRMVAATPVEEPTPPDPGDDDFGGWRPGIQPFPGYDNTGGDNASARLIIVSTQTDEDNGLTNCPDSDCSDMLTSGICTGGLDCDYGSLREALEATGCRNVVLYRSGWYSFSESDVTITDGCLTVYGASAPGNWGIRHGGIVNCGNSVVFSHVVINPGDGGAELYEGADHNAILNGYCADPVTDFLCDHCSLRQASGKLFQTIHEEGNEATGGPFGVILHRTLLAESLWRADNENGDSDGPGGDPDTWTNGYSGVYSSFGAHIGTAPNGEFTMFQSLSAHNAARACSEFGDGNLYIVNNICYDWGRECAIGTSSANCDGRYPWAVFKYESNEGTNSKANIIGNVFRTRSRTELSRVFAVGVGSCISCGTNESGYLHDNIEDDSGGEPLTLFDDFDGDFASWLKMSPVLSTTGITPLAGADTLAFVLANVGARPASRDAIDQRIIEEVTDRDGDTITDPDDDTPGYPSLSNLSAAIDVPADPNGAGSCGSGRSKIRCWGITEAEAVEP